MKSFHILLVDNWQFLPIPGLPFFHTANNTKQGRELRMRLKDLEELIYQIINHNHQSVRESRYILFNDSCACSFLLVSTTNLVWCSSVGVTSLYNLMKHLPVCSTCCNKPALKYAGSHTVTSGGRPVHPDNQSNISIRDLFTVALCGVS